MALLATTFTTEVVVLIIGLYFIDGGVGRRIGAIGLFVAGLQLSYSTQIYVSDLTALPTNTSLFFTPEIQRAWVLIFAICSLVALALAVVSIGKIANTINDMKIKNEKIRWSEVFEEFF